MLKMLQSCLLFHVMSAPSTKFIFVNFTVKSKAVPMKSRYRHKPQIIYSYKMESKRIVIAK